MTKAEKDNLEICTYSDAKGKEFVLLFKSLNGKKRTEMTGKVCEFSLYDYIHSDARPVFIYMRDWQFIKIRQKDLI